VLRKVRIEEFEKPVVLGFAYAEDGGPAIGANAFDGGLPVLERDVLGVLYLDARLALYAVCLWHILLI
jgi:hypothetical protein